MRVLSSVAVIAAVLAATSGVHADNKAPELPDHVSGFPLSSTNTRLAKDAKGRILTYEVAYQRLTAWGNDGEKQKSCSFLPGLVSNNTGAVGLNEEKAAVVLHGEPETIAIVDLSHCEIKARTEVRDVIPLEFFAAPGGWTFTGPRTDGKGYYLGRMGFDGKTTDTYSLASEIKADIQTRFPDVPASRTIAISVNGDTWLLPSATYVFTRPPQRGKDEYAFEPPACLSAETRELTGEEQLRHLDQRALSAVDERTKKETERVAKAAREGKGRTFIAAVATAASFGDFLGLLVRYQRAGHTGCRLDIWDMATEAPVAIIPVGPTCGNFLAMSDSTAWILKNGEVSDISLPPLTMPLKQPCSVFHGIVKSGIEAPSSSSGTKTTPNK